MSSQIGVLLVNLGTPDSPDSPAVRRYLKQFLSDPRVIDISSLGRWLLLNLFILPFRPSKSAEAYRKIWTERGSPLLFHTADLTKGVAERLGKDYLVTFAMRYGSPSIESAYAQLRAAGVSRVIVLPLYPQYSSSATGSSWEEVFRVFGKDWNVLPLEGRGDFYDHPGFIKAFAERGRVVQKRLNPDHVVFSFHGLPERQIRKSDPTGAHCLAKDDCCQRMTKENRFCYRAQSFQTARLIARELGLSPDQYSVTFQSRLGRTPWIQPFTDVVIPELAKKGKKRLMVYSPAFVADCLETLEEIGIRARESFLEAGGESLELVPSLNSEPAWVDAVVEMIRSQN